MEEIVEQHGAIEQQCVVTKVQHLGERLDSRPPGRSCLRCLHPRRRSMLMSLPPAESPRPPRSREQPPAPGRVAVHAASPAQSRASASPQWVQAQAQAHAREPPDRVRGWPCRITFRQRSGVRAVCIVGAASRQITLEQATHGEPKTRALVTHCSLHTSTADARTDASALSYTPLTVACMAATPSGRGERDPRRVNRP